MENSRGNQIVDFSSEGELEKLKELFNLQFSQLEIDNALGLAIAYSHISVAEYLLSLGADFSYHNFDGVYYAAHNGELEGLKFSIFHGVDININEGMLLNVSIYTSINSKNIEMTKWLIDNGADVKKLTQQSFGLIKSNGNDELKNLIKKPQGA